MASTAAFNVIVSGVQILPGDRYPVAECWGRFPSERERLLKLILASKAKGVILLRFVSHVKFYVCTFRVSNRGLILLLCCSGDVHFSEINQVVCSNGANTITEITSSGLTHSWVRIAQDTRIFIWIILHYSVLPLCWSVCRWNSMCHR